MVIPMDENEDFQHLEEMIANLQAKQKQIRFFVTWYGSIGGHKSTKSLSGKRLN